LHPIKLIRQQAGWTQMMLAVKAGCSHSTLIKNA